MLLPPACNAHATAAGGRLVRFMTASVARELGILLALSLMFPFMIHLLPVPGDARIGPRLLPMYYAPLLAALIGRTGSAWAIAVAAPWLNWLLTSHPAPRSATLMTIELLAFVLALQGLMRVLSRRWFLAVPAYFGAKVAAVVAVLAYPALNGGRPALAWAVDATIMAAPGIAILLFINWLVVQQYPTGSDGGGLAAA